MFTGLVKGTGVVASVDVHIGGATIEIDLGKLVEGLEEGASIAVNGCCLTVASLVATRATFEATNETLSRTNLGTLSESESVNLEPALAAGEPLGGHFVQGHIDCTGVVASVDPDGDSRRVVVEYPPEFGRFVVSKGSVALDGVSLTVSSCGDNHLEVVLVPHTIRVTTLGSWRAGHRPNIEFDVLAKYVERILGPYLETRRPLP